MLASMRLCFCTFAYDTGVRLPPLKPVRVAGFWAGWVGGGIRHESTNVYKSLQNDKYQILTEPFLRVSEASIRDFWKWMSTKVYIFPAPGFGYFRAIPTLPGGLTQVMAPENG